MTNRARLGLIAAAAIVAVAAFVLLNPGEESNEADDSGARAGQTTPAEPSEQPAPTATAPSAPPPPAERIVIVNGVAKGGARRIVVGKGDTVRLVVASDADDEIHLHGYDITREAAPGKPARFKFDAKVEGVFEIESHTAEDAGKEPLVGRLVVEPN